MEPTCCGAHMPQLERARALQPKIPHDAVEVPSTTPKTQHSQVNTKKKNLISVSCGYPLTVTDEEVYKSRSYTIASGKLRTQQIIGRIQLDQKSAILIRHS